jgi:hypothetical protein
MNKVALLNVARALRESPNPDYFNMEHYLNGCGTPACAIGHYGCRTDLQSIMALRNGWLEYTDDHIGVDYFDERMEEHFGLNQSQMTELFSGSGCGGAKTPTEAAEYIEAFVARGGVS